MVATSGTIIGVAGGAAAGGAIAKNKADRAQQRPFDSSYEGVDGLYSNFNGSDVALSSDNSLSSNLVNASYSNNDDRIYHSEAHKLHNHKITIPLKL